MNNDRRKRIAEVLALLGDAKSILESIAEEEREAFDNMPEGLASSERGEKAEAAADSLDEANDSLGSAVEALEGIE